jgi:hypothetical protein
MIKNLITGWNIFYPDVLVRNRLQGGILAVEAQEKISRKGLPDGFNFKPKIPNWLKIGGLEDVGNFMKYGLIIIRPFCIFCDHLVIIYGNLVYFPRFWYVLRRKIWQPCSRTKTMMEWGKDNNRLTISQSRQKTRLKENKERIELEKGGNDNKS